MLAVLAVASLVWQAPTRFVGQLRSPVVAGAGLPALLAVLAVPVAVVVALAVEAELGKLGLVPMVGVVPQTLVVMGAELLRLMVWDSITAFLVRLLVMLAAAGEQIPLAGLVLVLAEAAPLVRIRQELAVRLIGVAVAVRLVA